jgi:dTDP-4-dehydrorhamnose reductase
METKVVKKLRLLITGASGLLGQKLAQLSLEKGYDVYSTYNEHAAHLGNPIKLDLTDQNQVFKIINMIRPDAVVHTAAYTNVDDCEINQNIAWAINAEATKNIAEASSKIRAHLTYVSTDYVFDGKRGSYTEHDSTNPISYYAFTKLKGEEFTKKYAGTWCIARPSVIYGWGPKYKLNFATWLIINLQQGKEVKVLTDQYVSPTLNTNLAEMLLEITERKISGIFHTAGATRVSRHEFALKLADAFNLDMSLIKPAKISDMQWKAKRPKDSSLNVNKAVTLLNKKPLTLNQAFEVMKREKPSS